MKIDLLEVFAVWKWNLESRMHREEEGLWLKKARNLK